MNLHQRFPGYSRLLKLYPRSYRQQYEQEMLQTLADMLDDPDNSRQSVWLRTALDLPLSLAREQFHALQLASLPQTPAYIRTSSLIGGLLVLPFFVFVTLNTLLDQRLYNSLFWQVWMLFIWLLVLPGLAIVINLAATMKWVHDRRTITHRGFWRTLLDIKQTWPVLSIVIIGLGIIALVFGHDSVHCLGGNPIQEISNWHGTWQCIQNS
jgi:hypothetical protein